MKISTSLFTATLLASTVITATPLQARAQSYNELENSSPTAAERSQFRLLWIPLNRVATENLLKQEFKETLDVIIPPTDTQAHPNPFALSPRDFAVGMSLPLDTKLQGNTPTISNQDAAWFDQIVSENKLPNVFLTGGHHVISEGWHDQDEKMFLFMPTLMEAISQYPSARKVFDSVKLAILWGCNTMTNLEPHADNGAFLDSSQIDAIYHSSPAGRVKMIGTADKVNSLEFYKQRLEREYGPNSGQYEYTRNPKAEKCKGPGPFDDCPITNIDRIMPESFLYDGEHRLNEPLRMKQIFRNANLILGFSSASPSEESRAVILKKTLDATRAKLNAGLVPADNAYVKDVLGAIVLDSTPYELKIKVIETLRAAWTKTTYDLNRNRPSGSITPALPDLDRHGIFNTIVSKDTQAFAPYERR